MTYKEWKVQEEEEEDDDDDDDDDELRAVPNKPKAFLR